MRRRRHAGAEQDQLAARLVEAGREREQVGAGVAKAVEVEQPGERGLVVRVACERLAEVEHERRRIGRDPGADGRGVAAMDPDERDTVAARRERGRDRVCGVGDRPGIHRRRGAAVEVGVVKDDDARHGR